MRHLITYEKWDYKHSDLSEMVSIVKDILLDLEDEGFNTNVSFFYNPWITITIGRKKEFEYSDVSDVVERLQEYLKSFGLIIKWRNEYEEESKRPLIINNIITNPVSFSRIGNMYKLELNFHEASN